MKEKKEKKKEIITNEFVLHPAGRRSSIQELPERIGRKYHGLSLSVYYKLTPKEEEENEKKRREGKGGNFFYHCFVVSCLLEQKHK